MSILLTTDFKGFQKLAGSIENDIQLQAWINKYESKYIYQLFGVTLGKAIIANIANGAQTPTLQAYKDLWDPFAIEGHNTDQIESDGVLEILKCCIFWHYVIETSVRHTQAGATLTETDTAIRTNAARFAESRWNSMLDSWEAIHNRINEDQSIYPTFVYRVPPEPKHDGIL